MFAVGGKCAAEVEGHVVLFWLTHRCIHVCRDKKKRKKGGFGGLHFVPKCMSSITTSTTAVDIIHVLNEIWMWIQSSFFSVEVLFFIYLKTSENKTFFQLAMLLSFSLLGWCTDTNLVRMILCSVEIQQSLSQNGICHLLL